MLRNVVKAGLGRLGYEMHSLPVEPRDLYRGYSVESVAQRRFYNIGAGGFFHPYWTNIDYASESYSSRQKHPFHNFDLTSSDPLPIESNSAEIIYSSHTIEHIPDEAARKFLSECHRTVVPGGIVRLTMPDFDLARRAYQRGDQFFFLDLGMRGTLPQNSVHFFATQLAAHTPANGCRKLSDPEIVSMFSRGEPENILNGMTSLCAFNPNSSSDHINWWTYEKAEKCLRAAGFSTVYRSGYGQSAALPMRNTRLFDNTFPQMSLYVEAVRE